MTNAMECEWDDPKRQATLANRGLDFADAPQLFVGDVITIEDDRQDYGEERLVSIGRLHDRLVVLVWTWRDGRRRIMSMRHAHQEEWERYARRLARP